MTRSRKGAHLILAKRHLTSDRQKNGQSRLQGVEIRQLQCPGLVVVEHQRPHLNALPRWLVLFIWVGEGSVRDSLCTTIVQ